MTTKDLRLKYRLENKSYPFDEQLRIQQTSDNFREVAYIVYLETQLLEMKEGLRLIEVLLNESQAKEEIDTIEL